MSSASGTTSVDDAAKSNECNGSDNSPLSIHVISADLPTSAESVPQPSDYDAIDKLDKLDKHNTPRERRSIILSALSEGYSKSASFYMPPKSSAEDDLALLPLYSRVHDPGMVEFLLRAWDKWVAMGEEGRYEECFHPHWIQEKKERDAKKEGKPADVNGFDCIPPLVPCHAAFRNGHSTFERPSSNVMGAMGYYCTDLLTPIVSTLVEELKEDARVIVLATEKAFVKIDSGGVGKWPVVYAVTTHPGHHANHDNFGGYCYLNNAALCARLMQERLESGSGDSKGGENDEKTTKDEKNESRSKEQKCQKSRVAILDIDYHCGNGTASIFYEDPSIFFVSIHCDPDIEYPFNSGYADQTGMGEGVDTTMHIPLAPGAAWGGEEGNNYKSALEKAMDAIVKFDAAGFVVSLGLDTYDKDSVAVPGAGFKLSGNDYYEIGVCMGKFMKDKNIPTVFVQEGGYKMEVVGKAAAGVVGGFSFGAGDVEK